MRLFILSLVVLVVQSEEEAIAKCEQRVQEAIVRLQKSGAIFHGKNACEATDNLRGEFVEFPFRVMGSAYFLNGGDL
jgi:hypothetical protein